jgi:uncharacterized protein YdiU (UPF0061 family)
LPGSNWQTETLPFNADAINSFASLPAAFYTRLQATPLPQPKLVAASSKAAALIGLTPAEFERDAFVQAFIGNQLPASAQPLAAVYSGHQFGVWAGQLGDGRAILLGDIQHHGQRWEMQLKGAGQTPYSRMGDGRAVLRSSIREFLCSEAMAALGIPTSRALSVIGSSQHVMREQPESTAVVTRMAHSFVRFGSFEHWYYRKQPEHLKTLANYVLQQFYPHLLPLPNPYRALLIEITQRTAELVAHWQAVGFMHGVLNTDNMSILGITLDYGPFGFMEAFDPNHICNHTDQQGRYSYAMQPQIGYWNCCALAQAMLPLIGSIESTQTALAGYEAAYGNKISQLWHAKLGLQQKLPGDDDLIQDLLGIMAQNAVDFTLFFRRLGDFHITAPAADSAQDAPLRDLFIDPAAFSHWASQYRQRLQQENSQDGARQITMHAVNPKYVLRNYLAQVAIEKAQNGDFSEVQHLLALLERPFDEQPDQQRYAQLPPDWASHLEVSCSS